MFVESVIFNQRMTELSEQNDHLAEWSEDENLLKAKRIRTRSREDQVKNWSRPTPSDKWVQKIWKEKWLAQGRSGGIRGEHKSPDKRKEWEGQNKFLARHTRKTKGTCKARSRKLHGSLLKRPQTSLFQKPRGKKKYQHIPLQTQEGRTHPASSDFTAPHHLPSPATTLREGIVGPRSTTPVAKDC